MVHSILFRSVMCLTLLTGVAAAKPTDVVTVRGRVLDPDGKPIEGARLYGPYRWKQGAQTRDDFETPRCANTDAGGRFHFEIRHGDIQSEWDADIVAAADGYGIAWAKLPTDTASVELTLRLVKDQPIEGRIFNTEGKPLSGVRVRMGRVGKMRRGRLDDLILAWKQVDTFDAMQLLQTMYMPRDEKSCQAVTDKEGRFRLSGAGRDRFAYLQVRGSGISRSTLWVINRAGFDAAPLNKAAMERMPPQVRRFRPPQQLYGPEIVYVAVPGRRIHGTVREAGSGKPVPGYILRSTLVSTVSDREGRYQLDDLPKLGRYAVGALPPDNSSWLRAGALVDAEDGVQSLTVDFTVRRGIVVSGRVLDRATGKGVRGNVSFVPLPGNTFAAKPGYDPNFSRLPSSAVSDGRFKLAVLPGPGVLEFLGDGGEKVNGDRDINPFKPAEFDAKDRDRVRIAKNIYGEPYFSTINRNESLNFLNAVKVIDLAEDASAATCDLFVERGATQTVKIEDAGGKPLSGTAVFGLSAIRLYSNTLTIEGATCTVFALDPKKPRRLLFVHAGRKLAGSLTVRGDEKEPPVVRLGPAGSVRGRLLDLDGQPLAGVELNPASFDPAVREMYRHLRRQLPAIPSDEDGRFRIEGIVPGEKFTLEIRRGRTVFVGEPRIQPKQVKPGETLDLGEVRAKPRQ